jgi:PKD repeat protein
MPNELVFGGGWLYNDWDWYGIIDNIKVFNYAKTDFSDRFIEDGHIIKSSPVAEFSYEIDGYNVDYIDESTDSDGTIIKWKWDFGDGTTIETQNPQHTYSNNGYYTITLTVTDNDGLIDSKTIEIFIESPDPIALINKIIDHIKSMDLSKGQINRLINTLNLAIKFIEKEKINVVINLLNAFKNKINSINSRRFPNFDKNIFNINIQSIIEILTN